MAVKRFLVILISIALLITPVIAVLAAAGSVKGVYSHTFTAELADKYDLLYKTESPKIVVVGGSSVCFGLDSALLEQETGRKAVDFGLYATLGTKVMLDLSRRAIRSGDTVVIAPELDSQTLSTYFNQGAVLEALDGRYDMLRDIGSDNLGEVAGGFLTYVSKASSLKRQGIAPDPSGIYNRSSFNEYGDISYPRETNVMTLGYDANRPVDLSPDIVSDDFITVLNDYIDYCTSKGADVWFSFCPINKSGLKEGTTDDSIYAFFSYLTEKLHCRVISDINDYILPQELFYDTNFHLNDTGVRLRTQLLSRDILRAEGNNRAVAIDTPATPADTTPEPTPIRNDSDGTYIYKPFGKGLAVIGTTDAAKTMTEAEIPREFSGTPVYAILANAFSGCTSLREVTIHDNITFIENDAFAIPTLQKLFIDANDAEQIEAGDTIFGSNLTAVICLPDAESFESFVTGYWWSEYSGRMTILK